MHEIHQSHDHLISFALNEGKIKKLITCIHNQQNEWCMIHQIFLPPQNLRIIDHIYKIFDKMAHKNEFSERYYCNCMTSWNVNSRAPGPPVFMPFLNIQIRTTSHFLYHHQPPCSGWHHHHKFQYSTYLLQLYRFENGMLIRLSN